MFEQQLESMLVLCSKMLPLKFTNAKVRPLVALADPMKSLVPYNEFPRWFRESNPPESGSTDLAKARFVIF